MLACTPHWTSTAGGEQHRPHHVALDSAHLVGLHNMSHLVRHTDDVPHEHAGNYGNSDSAADDDGAGANDMMI
eukprot:3086391-Amphidinium_carterae.1